MQVDGTRSSAFGLPWQDLQMAILGISTSDELTDCLAAWQ